MPDTDAADIRRDLGSRHGAKNQMGGAEKHLPMDAQLGHAGRDSMSLAISADNITVVKWFDNEG